MWNLINLKKGWIPYFEENIEKLIKMHDTIYDKKNKLIFPKKDNVFRIFEELDLYDVKVIILGQDCYHSFEKDDSDNILPHAIGVSFGVPNKSLKVPPSLRNIVKEMYSETKIDKTFWSEYDKEFNYLIKQGVLFLNCALTVESGKPNSHTNIWRDFTDGLIEHISNNTEDCVFMTWGKFAQGKIEYIDTNKHLVLKSDHPSPLAQGGKEPFLGNEHFKKANSYLVNVGKKMIKWTY